MEGSKNIFGLLGNSGAVETRIMSCPGVALERRCRLPRSFAEVVFANCFFGDNELTDMKQRGWR
jgi:hypothetical protein